MEWLRRKLLQRLLRVPHDQKLYVWVHGADGSIQKAVGATIAVALGPHGAVLVGLQPEGAPEPLWLVGSGAEVSLELHATPETLPEGVPWQN